METIYDHNRGDEILGLSLSGGCNAHLAQGTYAAPERFRCVTR